MIISNYKQELTEFDKKKRNGMENRRLVLEDEDDEGERRPTFWDHVVLSCFVFCCCGWIFGLIAFILASQFK